MSLLCSQMRSKLCYFMILVMACFDVAVVIVYHPFIVVETIMNLVSLNPVNSIRLPFLSHLFVFSLTALLTMLLERYLALVYPFFHQKYVTKLRLIGVLLLLQLPFAIVFVFSPPFSSGIFTQAAIFGPAGALLLVILCLHYKIFSAVRTLRRRTVIKVGNIDRSNQTGIIAKQRKVTSGKVSTCLLAVVCLFVCYLPSLVFSGYLRSKQMDMRTSQTLCILHLWRETIVTLNSSLNCLIFFYKNSALRRHGEKILGKCLCARLLTPK